MSSAHYFFRNYDIKQVISLLCYMTEYPHTLTSTQKITRLYRCMIRREREWTLGENRCDPQDYHYQIAYTRDKLESLLHTPENSPHFAATLNEFEERCKTYLDPTMLIHDSRQYSATNGRSFVWSDKELLADPFGYYTGRMFGHHKPGYGFLYYPEFPAESTIWTIDPPSEYEDNVEEESFKQ